MVLTSVPPPFRCSSMKVFSASLLVEILLLFVRMSDKNSQQKIINEIKNILKKIGPEGLL